MKLSYEKNKLSSGFGFVIGCDEVGRACLAGPVAAAAVVLNPAALKGGWYREVRDSKLLTPEKREELTPLIKQHALAWGVGMVAPARIDAINIHHASLQAMQKAVSSLLGKASLAGKGIVCVDGRFTIPKVKLLQEAIVDGDNKVLSVACASVIAKVHRDSFMAKLDEKYPGYEFSSHKGYPTKKHYANIKQYGLSPIHRLSFCGNII